VYRSFQNAKHSVAKFLLATHSEPEAGSDQDGRAQYQRSTLVAKTPALCEKTSSSYLTQAHFQDHNWLLTVHRYESVLHDEDKNANVYQK
ncbi:hypothetical protein OFN63_32740, partial [Escherichia coli]|nr:hypothetical protein [Escherichia coli]